MNLLSRIAAAALAAAAALQVHAAKPIPTPPTPPRAVATFESIGLYWTPPANPGAAGCTVQYRRSADTDWKQGLAMWFDARNNECRGSLVQLAPGTNYVVQLGMPGQAPSVQLNAATWINDTALWPVAKTVEVQSSAQTLAITEGGTPAGYVVYVPAANGGGTIDVANGADYALTISAPYVIVRSSRQDLSHTARTPASMSMPIFQPLLFV